MAKPIRSIDRGSYRGGFHSNRGYQSNRGTSTAGYWQDGVHHIAQRNLPYERRLFGEPDDKEHLQTGINFEKYDDIPVEVEGDGCPEPVTSVRNIPPEFEIQGITYPRLYSSSPMER